MTNLVERLRAGDVRAAARMITLLEKRDAQSIRIIQEIYPQSGRAHLIGITGPPGVGKSCLIAGMIRRFRSKGITIGVLAVDPTSPFSGGALLGDRARMIEQSSDREVFIRSLASRGASGGLSAAVNDAADVLDVFGKDVILIETLGVGQGEIEIGGLVHTVVLVLMPGYGDTLQAMKAGIMEIADILVVNKADRPGADETVAELATTQHFQAVREGHDPWVAPIVKTSATTGQGLEDLEEAIARHLQYIRDHDLLPEKSRGRRTKQFLDILTQRIRDEFVAAVKSDPGLQKWVRRIGNRELDPYSASEEVIRMIRETRERRTGRRKANASTG